MPSIVRARGGKEYEATPDREKRDSADTLLCVKEAAVFLHERRWVGPR
jgi:hypothetical protein